MRQVESLLPPAWVARRVPNDDYGIDLEIEPFEAGRTLGSLLLVQVKGVDKALVAEETWTFSMGVRGLLYAEKFTVPAVLFVVPVRNDPASMRFLWLQDYIYVVLDDSKPKWREQTTVALHLPPENVLPHAGNFGRLIHIARGPRRTRQLGVLAHLASEFAYVQGRYADWRDKDDLEQMDRLLDQVFDLETLFGPNGWPWSRCLAAHVLERPRAMIKALLGDEPVEWEKMGWATDRAVELFDPEEFEQYLTIHQTGILANQLTAMVLTANDHQLRRATWRARGDHDF